MVKLYGELRFSTREIASIFGVSSSPIQKFMRDNSIERRDKHESNTKISKEDLDQIVKSHQNGAAIGKLAKKFGVCENTIWNHFKRARITFQRPTKKLNKQEIEKLYNEQRLPTTQIAPLLGVAKPTLLKFMRDNGIKIRTAGQSKTKLLFTDDVSKDIKKLYEEDRLSQKKIAEIYKVTQMTIGHILTKLQIKVRKRPDKYILRTKEMKDQICKWYHEYNLTQRDIAEVLGVGEIAVPDFMKEMGINVRTPEQRKVRRKVDLSILIDQYYTSQKPKKWKRGRKGDYNRVKCDQCGEPFYRTYSSTKEKEKHFCSYGLCLMNCHVA